MAKCQIVNVISFRHFRRNINPVKPLKNKKRVRFVLNPTLSVAKY